MSCNGCRVLRKGCNEKCILRQSLSGIESSQAQSNATVFVAKFFGRAGLMSFLSAVPDSQRPALFQSLLFEACGRTINPVSGAVGLLWTGNWNVCQSAVESVLRGGLIQAIPQFAGESPPLNSPNNESNRETINGHDLFPHRHVAVDTDLDLYLTPKRQRVTGGGRAGRAGTPNSDESDTTTFESGLVGQRFDEKQIVGGENKLLRLFF